MLSFELRRIELNESYIEYYLSPWDSDIFGFKVLNVSNIVYNRNLSEMIFLLKELERHCTIENVRVIVIKVDVSDNEIIQLLQNNNYKYIEMSAVPYINPQEIDVMRYENLCKNPMRRADKADLNELKRIARESFLNDRFHKDSQFNNEKANERYARWVENSFADDEDIYVVSYENRIAGFFILKVYPEKKYAEMKLGCIAPEFQGRKLGFSINAEIVLMLRRDGIELLDSPISMANFGIFNLYVSLGFKFKDQKVCFHNWL